MFVTNAGIVLSSDVMMFKPEGVVKFCKTQTKNNFTDAKP
jgi:hypothetical protein